MLHVKTYTAQNAKMMYKVVNNAPLIMVCFHQHVSSAAKHTVQIVMATIPNVKHAKMDTT